MAQVIPPDKLYEWIHTVGNDIFQSLRVAAQLNMNYSGGDTPPVAGKVTMRSGRLLRAVMGTGAREREESVARVVPTQYGVDFFWGVKLPYGALHEAGGTRVITPRMRKFYWAMYYLNRWGKKAMWKRLAITGLGQKNTINYPPRPYLRPAIDNSQGMIKSAVEKQWGNLIKFTIDRMIEQNKP